MELYIVANCTTATALSCRGSGGKMLAWASLDQVSRTGEPVGTNNGGLRA